jgi:hypothetical protein
MGDDSDGDQPLNIADDRLQRLQHRDLRGDHRRQRGRR